MSSNSSSSRSPPRVPPHIRLNSGQGEVRSDDQNSSSRQLIPQNSRPVTAKSQLQTVYSSTQLQDSSELLLPPSRTQTDRFRDNPSPLRSPMRSSYTSSRRSSWDSEKEVEIAKVLIIHSETRVNQDLGRGLAAMTTMSTPKQCQRNTTFYRLRGCYYFPKTLKRTITFTIPTLVASLEIAISLPGVALSTSVVWVC